MSFVLQHHNKLDMMKFTVGDAKSSLHENRCSSLQQQHHLYQEQHGCQLQSDFSHQGASLAAAFPIFAEAWPGFEDWAWLCSSRRLWHRGDRKGEGCVFVATGFRSFWQVAADIELSLDVVPGLDYRLGRHRPFKNRRTKYHHTVTLVSSFNSWVGDLSSSIKKHMTRR